MKSKSLTISLVFVFILILSGCFAKEKATGSTSFHNSNMELNANNLNNSMQDQHQPGKYGETPEDSIACVIHLSLYSEYFRQNNFQLAYDDWQKALEICPNASVNLYIHGRTLLLTYRYANETDPMKRGMLIDSLMWLWDERTERFGREGFIMGRKGVDMYMHRPERIQKIFDLTNRSIEIEKEESQADVLTINMQTATNLAQAGIKDPVEIFELYDRAMKIIEYNIKNKTRQAHTYERAKTPIESFFRPFSTCETLVAAFTPRFEENPEDIELLEQITTMLDESNCAEEELFYKTTKNLHRLKPTASSAFLMGRLESTQHNYRQAVDYFSQAVELYKEKDDTDQLYRSYMLKAEILYRQLRRYPQARESALEAAKARPDDGRPYILIGEMYASTADDCGDNDLTKRVAYWAAVDKFTQARNINTEDVVTERANQLISAYSQYFPDLETIFFHGFEEGDTYRVECWINETTRVRAR